MIFKRKFSFIRKEIEIIVLKENYSLGDAKHIHCIGLPNMTIVFTLDERNQLPEITGNEKFDKQHYFAQRRALSSIYGNNVIEKTIFVNAENIIPNIIKWMEFRRDFFKQSNIEEIKEFYDNL